MTQNAAAGARKQRPKKVLTDAERAEKVAFLEEVREYRAHLKHLIKTLPNGI
jgi:hypothetical protein